MTQARRSRAKKADEAQNPQDVVAQDATVSGPIYYCDEYLQALGLDPASAKDALGDAAAVRAQILSSPGIDHDALVRWAVSVWGSDAADRLNAAIDLAGRMGIVYRLD